MSIPDTSEVREAYQMTGDGLDFKSAARRRGEEFDEWLRSEKEAAWDQAVGLERNPNAWDTQNPYRRQLDLDEMD